MVKVMSLASTTQIWLIDEDISYEQRLYKLTHVEISAAHISVVQPRVDIVKHRGRILSCSPTLSTKLLASYFCYNRLMKCFTNQCLRHCFQEADSPVCLPHANPQDQLLS